MSNLLTFNGYFNDFDRLLPHIKGNVGFVFTKEDLAEIRDLLLANKVIRVLKRNMKCVWCRY